MEKRICRLDGCEQEYRARGWCNKHYQNLVRTGSAVARRPEVGICLIPDCNRRHSARGWCLMHYKRWRTNGDPLVARRAPSGTGFVDKNGYVRITATPRRQMMQHRFVMEQALGRKLQPFENVHHKNGIKTDNALNNLELWTKPQPNGQRPEDLVAWVVQYYPDLTEQMLQARKEAS